MIKSETWLRCRKDAAGIVSYGLLEDEQELLLKMPWLFNCYVDDVAMGLYNIRCSPMTGVQQEAMAFFARTEKEKIES
jgi:hypothetical protein